MLALRIALRYLPRRRRPGAVGVITLVAMAGVAVATAAMVCVLSVFNGFADIASERLSALDPSLELVPARGRTFGADTLLPRVLAVPGVRFAAPMLKEQGLVRMADSQRQVELWGVDSRWATVTGVEQILVDGEYMTDGAASWAAMAVGAAVDLGVRPSSGASVVEVWTPRRGARLNPASPLAAFRSDTLRVTAVWQADQPELDRSVMAVPIDRLRRLLDRDPDEASAIAVDAQPTKAVISALAAIPGVTVRTRMQQHPEAYRMISVEKWISFLMLAFILAIASFNIVATLTMLILEKRESIFLLTALGAGRRMVNAIFVLEGWLVSLIGAFIGLVLGALLSLAQQHWGLVKLAGDPAQLSITAYPARLDWLDLPIVLAVAAVTGIVTGLLTLAVRK